MSRIGKKPIVIPTGVDVTLDGSNVSVTGPKGALVRRFHPDMLISMDNGQVLVERPSDEKLHRSLHGTTRSVLANMVEGVSTGFVKTLDLVGVGYRAAKSGDKITMSLGFSHPVVLENENGIEVEVPSPTKLIIRGIDKEVVGAYAARVRAIRKPEPYKGKGIRYENEHVRRKVGKTGKK